MSDLEDPTTAAAPFPTRGLWAIGGFTWLVVLFCAVFAALQARFIAHDVALLRGEVEALHTQVLDLRRAAPGARAVPSPRPSNPRKGKKAKSSADGAEKAGGGKRGALELGGGGGSWSRTTSFK